MRFRSTSLGDVELRGTMSDLAPAGEDLLVLEIKTYEPVEWHLGAGIERKDILGVVKSMLKPSLLLHVIMIERRSYVRHPDWLVVARKE